MRDIGKNIKQLRIRKNMTQDELAERLFVTRQTVSNYETGKSKPDVEMLVRIAEIFQTDVQQLIYGGQSASEASQKRRLLIGAGITAGCFAVYLLLRPVSATWQDKYFASLNIFRHIAFLFSALIATGWTAAQAVSMALHHQPLRYTWVKYVRTVFVLMLVLLLGLNIFCFGTVTVNDWLYMHELRGEWIEEEVTNLATGESYNQTHYKQLPVPLPEWLQLFCFNYFLVLAHHRIWFFPLVGAFLWLLGFPKQKNTTPQTGI